MKSLHRTSGFGLPLLLAMSGIIPLSASAQTPVVTPIVVDTAVPIIVNAIKPKPKATGLAKFEGYVQNANTAQITVRAKGNDLAIQTFSLSEAVAAKMQQIVDKGGYQYGDRVTILYDPATLKAMKIKGKASKPV
jgi:hypothetical protein